MSIEIEQRDINTVKGFIRLALNDLDYSRWRSVSEDKQREAFWRGVRTLNELLVKIEKFENAMREYDEMLVKLENKED